MRAKQNKYEKDLDRVLTEIDSDGGMPVDAMLVVLLEYNARMLAKILLKLDELNKKVDQCINQ